ncbi:hypothetical protein AArcMg_3287 [Natrarchaeobaculum sulfurireducens]|uniref:Uncharacterized protein n=1 Tax=Natrarchaeobaculum sulfurireducens TaxID=2044521 RepID=A0A346PUS6_9EURY|nr:hypothetical protein AArcMg_3287 [Natrarchaeobaculum sulfurireducens]
MADDDELEDLLEQREGEVTVSELRRTLGSAGRSATDGSNSRATTATELPSCFASVGSTVVSNG